MGIKEINTEYFSKEIFGFVVIALAENWGKRTKLHTLVPFFKKKFYCVILWV